MLDEEAVLGLLAENGNVLITGPPGTGKSRLLGAVASRFETGVGGPVYTPQESVPIAASAASALPAEMGQVESRRVFRCAFHQGTKHRDFLTGIVPDLRDGASSSQFRVTEGTLYRASEHAKGEGAAALVVIDEINRGPAAQVFGGAIVAMEGDKRLGTEGQTTQTTQRFDLLSPKTGERVEYALPARLYLLAAMNQADVSVEPLDVAFLRRWVQYPLQPAMDLLRHFYGLEDRREKVLKEKPEDGFDVMEAAVRALAGMNARIAKGKSPEFEMGHGFLMSHERVCHDVGTALRYVATAWRRIKGHVDEVFFGDVDRSAAVLNVLDGPKPGNPYTRRVETFADTLSSRIDGPVAVGPDRIYGLLRTLVEPAES